MTGYSYRKLRKEFREFARNFLDAVFSKPEEQDPEEFIGKWWAENLTQEKLCMMAYAGVMALTIHEGNLKNTILNKISGIKNKKQSEVIKIIEKEIRKKYFDKDYDFLWLYVLHISILISGGKK